MSWNNFHKEREALHYGGEMYKKTVIRYFQLFGYSLKASSSEEGGLSDLIMWKEKKPDLHIETKASKESIFAKGRFRQEILRYFCLWKNLPAAQKFDFHIVVGDLARPDDTRKVLTREANEKSSLEWFKEREGIKLSQAEVLILQSAKDSEILDFLHSTSVSIASGYILDRVVREREQELKVGLNLPIRRLYSEVRKRRIPIREPSLLTINFLMLSNPQYFWEIPSKYKLKDTILKKAKELGIRNLPTFTVPRFEGETPVIRTFDENLHKFRPFSKKSPMRKPIERLSFQREIELLNAHLRKFLWSKGLNYIRNLYFFEYQFPLEKNPPNQASPMKKPGPRGLKIVTKPRYKENGELNFVEHYATEIRLASLGKSLGLFIWPRLIFTYDGRSRIGGTHASRIKRKYLKPDWNRNDSKLSELRFWTYFLTLREFPRTEDHWFDEFAINDIKTIEVPWSSGTIDIRQKRLDFILKGDDQ
ncbi:MAG: hypothetical protein ACE5OZ_22445 [Candidatus Heimdallarchaeota archaeon]